MYTADTLHCSAVGLVTVTYFNVGCKVRPIMHLHGVRKKKATLFSTTTLAFLGRVL